MNRRDEAHIHRALQVAADRLLAFVREPVPLQRESWGDLACLLDDLARAGSAVARAIPDSAPELAPKDADPPIDRLALERRFPDFGMYATVQPLTPQGELCVDSAPTVGDAIDDLLDLSMELRDGCWIREHHGPHAEAETLAWSFRVHWGRHLRDLTSYLHQLLHEG